MNAAPLDLTAGLPFVLALRLVTTAVTLLTASRPGVARRVAFLGSTVASLVTGIVAARALVAVSPVQGVLLVHQASGFSLRYAIDGLSAWFLLVLSVLAVPIALYSLGYIATPHWSRRSVAIGATFNLLIGAVEVVFVAADVVTFLAAWELMTLTTAALVATEHEYRASRRAAYLYLIMSHVGTGFLIAGFLILASLSGSFSFAAVLSGDRAIGPIRHVLFVLFLHRLRRQGGHHSAPCLAARGAPGGPHQHLGADVRRPDQDRHLRHGPGLRVRARRAAAVLGRDRPRRRRIVGDARRAVCADAARSEAPPGLPQHREHRDHPAGAWRRDDRCSSYGPERRRCASGLAASLYHVLNHAVFKGLLFLGAGGVVIATGTRQIEQLGGLLRRMPWTGLCFLVGAMAISGLPPLNGFASEWLTFQAFLFGFDGTTEPVVHLLFSMAGALLALTTALAAACFVKAFGIGVRGLAAEPPRQRTRWNRRA